MNGDIGNVSDPWKKELGKKYRQRHITALLRF